jgi:pyridoxamine 5'-phosphate oxidase
VVIGQAEVLAFRLVGRALWGWPELGAPFDAAEDFPAELADETPLPEHFQLLRIDLAQVELLELWVHPHQRRRWRRDYGWSEGSA